MLNWAHATCYFSEFSALFPSSHRKSAGTWASASSARTYDPTNQLSIVVDQVRKPTADENFDGEDLLDGVFESAEANGLTGLNIKNPHATGPFLEPVN